MDALHKAKKSETYVITPTLNKGNPEIPDPEVIPKRYIDENVWLWKLYSNFENVLKKATRSLEEFRKVFKNHE